VAQKEKQKTNGLRNFSCVKLIHWMR